MANTVEMGKGKTKQKMDGIKKSKNWRQGWGREEWNE